MGPDGGIKKDDIIENLYRTMTGYEFNLRGISTKITIRLDKIKKTGKVAFDQSHFIYSSEQAGSYMTSHPWGHSEEHALDLVLGGFRRFYKIAMEAGHKPDDSWLKLNSKFKGSFISQ